MLRDEAMKGTAIGLEGERYTAQGRMVPDSVAVALIESWLGGRNGFVFDGFPRTVAQAESLQSMLDSRGSGVDAALYLTVPELELKDRVAARLVCRACGRSIRIGFHVTSGDESCPTCSGRLMKRKDDSIEAFGCRMVEYRERTEPLVDFYRECGLLTEIDGAQSPTEVFEQVCEVLEGMPCR
jgi:adenylate kinase